MGIKERLEMDGNRIDEVFHRHNIPGRATGGQVTPWVIRYRFDLERPGDADHARGLADELASALGVSACRVYRRGMAVVVEYPRGEGVPVHLLPLLRRVKNVPPVTAALGVDDEGVPLLIRLPAPEVGHVLVVGEAGAGKTNLLRAMALSLALRHPKGRDLALVLIDPRGGQAFGCFEGLPHLARPVVRGNTEAREAVESLVRLVEQRGLWPERRPVVVAVIDGVEGIPSTLLARLVEKGHRVGVHVVVAAAEPPSVLARFPVRIVGRTATARYTRLTEPGDFIAVAEGRETRFKAAYVEAGEVVEVVEAVRRERSEALRPQAAIPLPASA